MRKTVLIALILFTTAASAQYVPTDAERARWTLHDMRSWKIALEAFKIDHGSYPAATSLEDAAAAIRGTYIAAVPMNDAWGRPYVYQSSDNGFVLASAGADGKFDRTSWKTAGKQTSLDADAVIDAESKFWLRSWEMK